MQAAGRVCREKSVHAMQQHSCMQCNSTRLLLPPPPSQPLAVAARWGTAALDTPKGFQDCSSFMDLWELSFPLAQRLISSSSKHSQLEYKICLFFPQTSKKKMLWFCFFFFFFGLFYFIKKTLPSALTS